MEKIIKNRFYVYHKDTNDISKFESKEDFVLWLQNSADWTCQTYATSMKDLRKFVFDTYSVKI